MAKSVPNRPPLEEREFKSVEEIDSGVAKLDRRIRELEQLDIAAAVLNDSGADDVAQSNLRATIRDRIHWMWT